MDYNNYEKHSYKVDNTFKEYEYNKQDIISAVNEDLIIELNLYELEPLNLTLKLYDKYYYEIKEDKGEKEKEKLKKEAGSVSKK